MHMYLLCIDLNTHSVTFVTFISLEDTVIYTNSHLSKVFGNVKKIPI
jgi:hypothetical protein